MSLETFVQALKDKKATSQENLDAWGRLFSCDPRRALASMHDIVRHAHVVHVNSAVLAFIERRPSWEKQDTVLEAILKLAYDRVLDFSSYGAERSTEPLLVYIQAERLRAWSDVRWRVLEEIPQSIA